MPKQDSACGGARSVARRQQRTRESERASDEAAVAATDNGTGRVSRGTHDTQANECTPQEAKHTRRAKIAPRQTANRGGVDDAVVKQRRKPTAGSPASTPQRSSTLAQRDQRTKSATMRRVAS